MFVAGSIGCSFPSQAAQWQLGAGIETTLFQTRTEVSEADVANSSEIVWNVSPYLLLQGRGRSLDLNARLGVEHSRNIDTGSTVLRPAASLNTVLTIIDRRAWVSIDANVARESESVDGTAQNFLGDLESENTQFDFSLSERGSLPLGSASQVDGAHSFSTSGVSNADEPNSRTHLLNLESLSYLRGSRSFVITELNYQHTYINDAGVFESGQVGTRIGMPVHEISADVLLSIGHEWYELMLDEQNLDGIFWGLGFRFQPTDTFSFEAGYGERSYGRTPTLRSSLIGRRNTLSVEWSRQSAFQRISQFSDGLPATVSSNGTSDVASPNSVEIDELDVLGRQSTLSPLMDDVQAIDEVIRLDHEYRGRVSTLNSGIGVSKRSSINELDSSESTLTFATVELTRTMGQSFSASAGLRVAESKNDEETGKQRISRVSVTLNWVFRNPE